VYTFREFLELLLGEIRRKRWLVDVPLGLAALQARLMSILPNPPLTPDQVELLKSDNIVSSGAMTLASLGIASTPAEVILRTYLDRFRRGGWYERRSP
jgi:NADH dehydrogenase